MRVRILFLLLALGCCFAKATAFNIPQKENMSKEDVKYFIRYMDHLIQKYSAALQDESKDRDFKMKCTFHAILTFVREVSETVGCSMEEILQEMGLPELNIQDMEEIIQGRGSVTDMESEQCEDFIISMLEGIIKMLLGLLEQLLGPLSGILDAFGGPDGPLGALTGSLLGGENDLLGQQNGGLLGALMSGKNGDVLEGLMTSDSGALLAGLTRGENGGLLGELLSKGKEVLSGLLGENEGLKGSGKGEGNTSGFPGKDTQLGGFEKGKDGGHVNGHAYRNSKEILVEESGIIEGITESIQVDESLTRKVNGGSVGGKKVSVPWDNKGDFPGGIIGGLTEQMNEGDNVVSGDAFERKEVFRGPINIVIEPTDNEPYIEPPGRIIEKEDDVLDGENRKIREHEHIGEDDIHRNLIGGAGVVGRHINEFEEKNDSNTIRLGGVLSDNNNNPKDKHGRFSIEDGVLEIIAGGSNEIADNLGGLTGGTLEGIDGNALGSKNSDLLKELEGRIMGRKNVKQYTETSGVTGGDDVFEVLEIENDIEGKNVVNSNVAIVDVGGKVAGNMDGALLKSEIGDQFDGVQDKSAFGEFIGGPTHKILEEDGHLKSVTDDSKSAEAIISNKYAARNGVLIVGNVGQRDGTLWESLGQNDGDFSGGDRDRIINEKFADEIRSHERLRKEEVIEHNGSTNGDSEDLGRLNDNINEEDVVIGGFIEIVSGGVEVMGGSTDGGSGQTIVVQEPNGSGNERGRFVGDFIENINGEHVVEGHNKNSRYGGRGLEGFIEEVNADEELDDNTTGKGGIAGKHNDNVRKLDGVEREIIRSGSERRGVVGEPNGSASEERRGNLEINDNLFIERGQIEEIDGRSGSGSKSGDDSAFMNSITRGESVVDVLNSKDTGEDRNVGQPDNKFNRDGGFNGEFSGTSGIRSGIFGGFGNTNVGIGGLFGELNDNVSEEKVTGTFGGLSRGFIGETRGGLGDKSVSAFGRPAGNVKSGNLGGEADLFGGIIGEI